MKIESVKMMIPEGCNIIIGQSHFIKTVEDIHEAMVNSVPNIEFGVAFCEASGKRLIRHSGNSEELREVAVENAKMISAGHVFVLLIRNAYPINVLGALKSVPEVCRIFCATANPLEVIVAETEQGRGVLGVVDGETPLGVEEEEDVEERKKFLREIGYKL
ncbi:MAG: adenosine-specific kinase [Archaeoglobi archaeon]|nr:adenosine-specific kinase [Candidatus Mnemosynella sp.]